MARDVMVKIKFRGAFRTLNVNLHGTALDLKNRFEADRKIPTPTLMVEFGGRQLDDAEILKDCGVEFESVVCIEEYPQEYTHPAVNTRNRMTMFVKSLVSTPYELTIPRSATVRLLKDILAASTNLSTNLLALRHNEKLLTTENEALLDLGVGHGGVLLLEEDMIRVVIRWFDNSTINFGLSRLNVGEPDLYVLPTRAKIHDLRLRLGCVFGLPPQYQSLEHGGTVLYGSLVLEALELKHGDTISVKKMYPPGTGMSLYTSLPAWQPVALPGEGPQADTLRFIKEVQLRPSPSVQAGRYTINVAKECHRCIIELARINPNLPLKDYPEQVYGMCNVGVQRKDVVAIFVVAGILLPHEEKNGQLVLRIAGYTGDVVPTVEVPLFD